MGVALKAVYDIWLSPKLAQKARAQERLETAASELINHLTHDFMHGIAALHMAWEHFQENPDSQRCSVLKERQFAFDQQVVEYSRMLVSTGLGQRSVLLQHLSTLEKVCIPEPLSEGTAGALTEEDFDLELAARTLAIQFLVELRDTGSERLDKL